MIKIFFSCAFLFLSIGLLAQKHSIYFNAGGACTLNYEGEISGSENSGDKMNFRFNGGRDYDIAPYSRDRATREEYMLGALLVALFGKKNSYFEVSMGSAYAWSFSERNPSESRVILISNVGYRVVSNNFLLRIGVGVPEVLYLGIGIRF